jgi:hypothetical protein
MFVELFVSGAAALAAAITVVAIVCLHRIVAADAEAFLP